MGPAGPAASPRATAAAGVAVLLNSCTNLKQGISRGCGLSGYLVAKKKLVEPRVRVGLAREGWADGKSRGGIARMWRSWTLLC